MNELLQQVIYYRTITIEHQNIIVDIISNSKLCSDTICKVVYAKDGKYTFRYNKKLNHLYLSGANFYNLIFRRRRRRSGNIKTKQIDYDTYEQVCIDFICDMFYKEYGYDCDFTAELWR